MGFKPARNEATGQNKINTESQNIEFKNLSVTNTRNFYQH